MRPDRIYFDSVTSLCKSRNAEGRSQFGWKDLGLLRRPNWCWIPRQIRNIEWDIERRGNAVLIASSRKDIVQDYEDNLSHPNQGHPRSTNGLLISLFINVVVSAVSYFYFPSLYLSAQFSENDKRRFRF